MSDTVAGGNVWARPGHSRDPDHRHYKRTSDDTRNENVVNADVDGSNARSIIGLRNADAPKSHESWSIEADRKL